MDQTLPSLHGFDSLLSEAKPPASMLVSPDHDLLGLWRPDMHGSFSPTVLSSPATFKQPHRGEICVVANLHLVAWSWKSLPGSIYPPLLPRASSRENQSFCLFWGGHALYFLFCIPSALETSLIFVSSLEKLEDNTYFILHSSFWKWTVAPQEATTATASCTIMYYADSSPPHLPPKLEKLNMVSFQLLL